jgi:ribosomal protein S21
VIENNVDEALKWFKNENQKDNKRLGGILALK